VGHLFHQRIEADDTGVLDVKAPLFLPAYQGIGALCNGQRHGASLRIDARRWQSVARKRRGTGGAVIQDAPYYLRAQAQRYQACGACISLDTPRI